jgi:predicted GIY-YIG superfamily endonuclease
MTYTAKIYKIVNTINDDIYVGSTKNELRKRLNEHKKDAKKKPERNGLYQMMNEHLFENFRIVLIETVECENKEEQVRHEQLFIDALKPKLNKHNAYGNKCEHNRERSKCKQCGGGQICEHNRIRSTCKQCGGSSICEHNRERSICKQCGGGSICEHNRIRSKCKQCGGGSICEHNRERSICKQCGGSQICEHNKRRSICKECGGGSICEHNRIRSTCKQCGGSQICEHNKRRSICKECGGSQTQKVYCYDCDTEFRKNSSKVHFNSVKHLRNTLPINY